MLETERGSQSIYPGAALSGQGSARKMAAFLRPGLMHKTLRVPACRFDQGLSPSRGCNDTPDHRTSQLSSLSKVHMPPRRQCYASALGDCEGGLTREHYVSETILNHIAAAGGGYRIGGFHWQRPDGTPSPSIASMTARVLCARHNERLSDLDSEALKLFQFLEDWTPRVLREENIGDIVHSMKGELLERWLLKVLTGVVASNNAARDGSPIRGKLPSREAVETLFGLRPFPDHFGLSVTAAPQSVILKERAFRFGPLFNDVRVCGAFCAIYDIPFVLLLEPVGADPGGVLAHSNYHPAGIRVLRRGVEGCSARLDFQWSGGGSGTYLDVELQDVPA